MMILGEMCVLSLIYIYVAGSMRMLSDYYLLLFFYLPITYVS